MAYNLTAQTCDPSLGFVKLPTYLETLERGKLEPVDYQQDIINKPPWWDDEKYNRGRKFALEHIGAIFYAQSLAVLLGMNVKGIIQPLIFSNRSDTPDKATTRYMSTAARVMSWFEEDPWIQGSLSRRNIHTVRMLHRNVSQIMTYASKEELRRRTTIEYSEVIRRSSGLQDLKPFCPLSALGEKYCTKDSILLQDLQSSCPITSRGYENSVWLSQYDMAGTQIAFVGLTIAFPEETGIHGATDEDLDSLRHVWRSIGYLLGIKDEYNACNGGLEETRKRIIEFIKFDLKPSFSDVNFEFEHMTRSAAAAITQYVPKLSFESVFKNGLSLLDVDTPRFDKSLTFSQRIMYHVIKFTFKYLFQIPLVVKLSNFILRIQLKHVQKTSVTVGPESEQTFISNDYKGSLLLTT